MRAPVKNVLTFVQQRTFSKKDLAVFVGHDLLGDIAPHRDAKALLRSQFDQGNEVTRDFARDGPVCVVISVFKVAEIIAAVQKRSKCPVRKSRVTAIMLGLAQIEGRERVWARLLDADSFPLLARDMPAPSEPKPSRRLEGCMQSDSQIAGGIAVIQSQNTI